MRPTIVLLAITFLALGCKRQSRPTEKYFSGEPVKHWLDSLQSSDPKVRKKSVDVLGNVGPSDPAVIPALIAAVRDKDASVRDAAVLALSKIGPPAAEAATVLQEATRDPNATVRDHAAKALERVLSK